MAARHSDHPEENCRVPLLSGGIDTVLAEEAGRVLGDVLTHWDRANGWEILQERDEEGNAKGPLPYTDTAIEAFTRAHEADPTDVEIVHHLAIAHHARAWDWELQADARAPAEWKKALGYWRFVASSGEFWSGMKQKLLACDADADPVVVDILRRDLMMFLLEVHVDFIRAYSESNQSERAASHVAIVRQASIAPAARKKLADKVFASMAGSVPRAVEAGEYDSALDTLDAFWNLFPDHLPAARRYAEVCVGRVRGMTIQSHWLEIMDLGRRALPVATRIVENADTNEDALAREVLGELSYELARRAHDRAAMLCTANRDGHLGTHERDQAGAALEFAITWADLGQAVASPSRLGDIQITCLGLSAHLSISKAVDALNSREADDQTRRAVAQDCCADAQMKLDRANNLGVNDEGLRTFLSTVQKRGEQLRDALVEENP